MGSERGRRAGAGLWHFVAHVRRNIHVTRVGEIGRLTVHGRDEGCTHGIGGRKGQSAVMGGGGVEWRGRLRIVTAIRAAGAAGRGGPRGKRGSCSGGSLLHRAGMVVLVAGQGGAARKRLLAVGIGTLVRALSRVDTAMTCQRTRVTEGLAGRLAKGDSRRQQGMRPPCHIARTCEASRPCGRIGGRSGRSAG